jgi:hypothetical protein
MKLIVTLSLLISTIFSQINPDEIGLKLTYTLQFNIIKMGTGYLSINENDTISATPVHHITFAAKTSKFADRIYKIRDRVDVWMNQDDLTTLRVTKKIREGDYHRDYQTDIFADSSIAITNEDTIRINGPVRDPYSLIFYLRSKTLELGNIYSFTTFDGKKPTDFQVIVDGKETVTTPSGKYSCKIVRPFREGKALLKNSGEMMVWYSDGELRIPVQIQIKLNFGSMLLQLKSISS